MDNKNVLPEVRALLGVARFSGYPFLSADEYLRLTAHYSDSDACVTGRMANAVKVERQRVLANSSVSPPDPALLFDLGDPANPLAAIQFALDKMFTPEPTA